MTTLKKHNSLLEKLSGQYLDFLLSGDRYSATQMVMDAVKNGISVKYIYLGVFEPSQHKIGVLWQNNQISVAQEHFCTAATQHIMSQLYPYIFQSKKNGYKMIATCVGGELHELGARMVSDFFEIEGWDTYYLGANMPTSGIMDTIIKLKPDLIAISATMTYNIVIISDLIKQIREKNIESKIMVGGRPFNISNSLWQKVGADAHAHNASEAITIAKKLLEEVSYARC